ncbi:MAG TPA: hypothetical protein PLX23_01940 [Candidatus Hydrogenedens sp.]|nr:hypothetical protein [Candidatus Hydrogenedens sp.]
MCLFLIISLFVLMFLFYYFLLSWLKFIISAILLAILVGSFILIYQFLKIVKLYSINRDYVLDELFKKAEIVFTIEEKTDNNSLEQIKNKYEEALEGIGDILEYETKIKKKFISVKDVLSRIRDLNKDIIKNLGENPKVFEKFAFTKDYFEDNKKSKFVTKFILRNIPKTYLSPLLAPFNQIERTLITALESGNYEISKSSLSYLYYLLLNFSELKDHELFVEIILGVRGR